MRVTTYNAASIRARLPRILEWLEEFQPDVIGIQETKVEDHLFPFDDFAEAGYSAVVHGQKSWNGVCLLSKRPMTDVTRGFPEPELNGDARLIAGTLGGIRIINTYVPNGNTVGTDKWEYKMRWLEGMKALIANELARGLPLIWMGDINIAPQPHDVYDSARVYGDVGHHPDEFSRLGAIVGQGLIDCFRLHEFGGGHYTFWDFKVPNALERGIGWRIDHIYASESLAELCQSCEIDLAARKKDRPSDHTFVTADFDL